MANKQNITIHDTDWVYNKDKDLYVARKTLIVDDNTKKAAEQTRVELGSYENGSVFLTKDLSGRFNEFLGNLTPTFSGYEPSVQTFEEYLEHYNWSEANDKKLWVNLPYYEMVKHEDSYGVADSASIDEPELSEPTLGNQIDLSLYAFPVLIRLVERKVI